MKWITLISLILACACTYANKEPYPLDKKYGTNFVESLPLYIEYYHLLNSITLASDTDPNQSYDLSPSIYTSSNIDQACWTLNCTDLYYSNQKNIEKFNTLIANLSIFFYLTPEKYEEILNFPEFINNKLKAKYASKILLAKANPDQLVDFTNKAKNYIQKFQSDYPDVFQANCIAIGKDQFCWD